MLAPAGRNYINELRKVWDIEIVGFTNRSQERREAVATEMKLPGFSNLSELLEQAATKPRVVVIATANQTHEDFAIEAMQAGLDVFCEKPMAMTLAGASACSKLSGKRDAAYKLALNIVMVR